MLDRLVDQTRPPDHLLVVDNSPSEEIRAIIESRDGALEMEYLAAPENLGPAGGIALGMERLVQLGEDQDWVVLLDDDNPPRSSTELEDLFGFAQTMLAKNPRTGGVGVVGGLLDRRRGRLIRVPDEQLEGAVPVDHIPGNNLPFYRIEVIRQVGTFRSELFFGFEELEYGLRLNESGFAIYAHGRLWRDIRALKGRLGKSKRPSYRVQEPDWRRYYSLRNLVFILRAHQLERTALRVILGGALAKPLVNLPIHPVLSVRNLAVNWRAVRDGWLGRMGRTVEPDSSVPRLRTAVWR